VELAYAETAILFLYYHEFIPYTVQLIHP